MCDAKQKTIPVAAAVGSILGHDITEVNPRSGFKGRRFKRGHLITAEDVPHLRDLGKENIYVLDVAEDQLHEDDAVRLLAPALAGANVEISAEPREGRLDLLAARDGLLKIDVPILDRFNGMGEVICASRHSGTMVKKGEIIAGTRSIPLVIERDKVTAAVELAAQSAGGVVAVLSLAQSRLGVIITGNEVYHGRIEDAFEPVMRRKAEELGLEFVRAIKCPDEVERIAAALIELRREADLIVMTAGMSVDPDDVTMLAAQTAGVRVDAYGAPVLPGSMLMVGRFEDGQPVIGVPACAIHHHRTALDIVLPLVLAGKPVGPAELAKLGHGGLCWGCEECRYPVCPFGK